MLVDKTTFDNVVETLSELERARDHLHEKLREAAFSYTVACRAEEKKGNDLEFCSLCNCMHRASPLIRLSTYQEDSKESQFHCFEIEENKLTEQEADNCEAKSTDPIYAFSQMPSAELRECQRLYQEVLQWIVAVVNVQIKALTLLHIDNQSDSSEEEKEQM